MIRRELALPQGFALNRTATMQIVQTAARFQARLLIEQGERTINVKSMLGMLSLGMSGTGRITLMADGPDAEEALAAVAACLSR